MSRPNLPGRATHFRLGFGPTLPCGVFASAVRFTRTVGREVNCKNCLRTKIYKQARKERIVKVGTT
jgi:hypothetical protein